ncbi:DUF6882 domain-containing protein [Streptomyces sp. NRRL WC-3725]|uniref:DUF6882 domain-containing protein n=1 Tax=Streptomyces sp. NRRL WC-3725 TaxID=1463933 RepID=UPI001F1580DC|nr:DUF6882 domain-containing protein [Streptomyces sp. NRRL WC-3725]
MKGIVDWSWASGRLRGMGTFKRANEAESAGQAGERAELNVLLLRGEDMIEQLARAPMSWELGSADRWDLNQTTGMITWTFPDKTATASAQILGSFSPDPPLQQWPMAAISSNDHISGKVRSTPR